MMYCTDLGTYGLQALWSAGLAQGKVCVYKLYMFGQQVVSMMVNTMWVGQKIEFGILGKSHSK